ncbi:MAG: hypothetical protein KKC64_03230 [Spirochaetes bacterium]|nr:hypothetical protein [Spirochaetota bacterium]
MITSGRAKRTIIILLIVSFVVVPLTAQSTEEDTRGTFNSIILQNGSLLLSSFETGTSGTFINVDSGSYYSWTYSEEILSLLEIDVNGQPIRRESYNDNGNLLTSIIYSYENGLLLESSSTDLQTATNTIILYNENGKPITETTHQDNKLILSTSYLYDTHSQIIKKTLNDNNSHSITEIEYVYTENGELQNETWIASGFIQKLIEYQNPLNYIISFYDAGILFAKDFYVDGVRKLQELWQGDVLIRERKFGL